MQPQDFVLIHGWACNQGVWQAAGEVLGVKHRVHALDLPPMVDLFSYRDSVGRLIKEQGLKKVVLVGWSMGSLVALQVAREWPDLIKGLVLVSGTGKFVRDGNGQIGGLPSVLVTRMRKRLVKDFDRTIRDFYRLMFSSREISMELDRSITEKHLNQGRRWRVAEALAGLEYLQEVDLRRQLPEIPCPTLLIHGEHDEICPLEGAVYLRDNLPQAHLAVFPGCGHIPFLTAKEDFDQCLEGWVNRLWP